MTARLYLAALVCFFLFSALGFAIVRRPRILWDVHARSLLSKATPVALFFTWTGRSRPLFAGYLIATAAYALAHANVLFPIAMAFSQTASQFVVEGFKLVYRRLRPDYYVSVLDKGHSYPSGHATTAVVTYTGWAVVVMHAPLPHTLKWSLFALLVLWAAAIDWSRLALGAHFFSDIFGGTLFGTAWLCMFEALAANAFFKA